MALQRQKSETVDLLINALALEHQSRVGFKNSAVAVSFHTNPSFLSIVTQNPHFLTRNLFEFHQISQGFSSSSSSCSGKCVSISLFIVHMFTFSDFIALLERMHEHEYETWLHTVLSLLIHYHLGFSCSKWL